MNTSIKLLLADDHSLVREGLKQLFALTNDIEVAGEAANAGQVIDFLRGRTVDIVLLDMSMPGIGGAGLIARIVAQDVAPPVLVLSMHNEVQVVRRALAAGASGYLTKDCNPDVLLTAIRKVASGRRFLDPVLAEEMAFEAALPGKLSLPHEHLSGREFEVLTLLVRGLSVGEIADQLAISNKTVSTHKTRLMEKMGFSTQTDLVRYAIDHDLVNQ